MEIGNKPVEVGKPDRDTDPRINAYTRIMEMMQKGMQRYIEAHPEWAGDERNKEAVRASVGGMRGIFRILEDYDIEHRGECIPVNSEYVGEIAGSGEETQ